MEEMNHFSHKNHVLKLVDVETVVGASFDVDGEKPQVIGCYACEKIIPRGFAYGCIQCHYFLHEACAQLPPTLNCPPLYQHPLTLIDFGTTPYTSWVCNVCITLKSRGFCYSFKREEDGEILFTACVVCCVVEIASKVESDAMKEEARIKVEVEGHPDHTLTLQLRPASFRCDACNSKDEGLFYQCDTCDFWIHKTCFSLTPTLNSPHHPNHPLILVYSVPEKLTKFPYYCEFCKKFIRLNVWLYHCGNCRYFAHIKCALDAKQPPTPGDGLRAYVADQDEKDLLHFPMPHAFTDPLKLLYFEKKIGQVHNEITKSNHWSHRHSLILNVEKQANSMCVDNHNDSIEVCHVCVRPLSLPYYSCKDGCSLNLHKYCAELPLKLEHRLHSDHSLQLVDTFAYQEFYTCNGCTGYGNTFAYVCESCNFCLDVNCAFLPDTIQHTSHEHPLTQVFNSIPPCDTCLQSSEGVIYACEACSFHLDLQCALNSPSSVAHRYCKGHEIPFTYPPVENHPEDFFCEICETEMHPKLPLYYCHKCKNSFLFNA